MPKSNHYSLILAGGGFGQPADVMRPTLGMAIALRGIGKAAVGHPQQRAAVLFDQIDFDQPRSRRQILAGTLSGTRRLRRFAGRACTAEPRLCRASMADTLARRAFLCYTLSRR